MMNKLYLMDFTNGFRFKNYTALGQTQTATAP